MRWTRGGFLRMAIWAVVVVCALVFVAALATADPLPGPNMIVGGGARLMALALLWVLAIWIMLQHWWSRTGARLAELDPPARLLAAATATLPERRREWAWR